MSSWGWSSLRASDTATHLSWFRPLAAIAPWVSLMLLMLMFYLIDGKLTASSGLLFDLPHSDMSETAAVDVVAMVVPLSHNTIVFFDDSRYNLSDEASIEQLRRHFSEVFAKTREKTLLALADRRVSGGELMKFAEVAKKGGAVRILFAEKKETHAE